MEIDVQAFWRDGFTMVKNAYTPDEVQYLREQALEHKETHKGDLLSHPTLSSVMTDGKMADVARAILDREDLVYYGDTSVAIREGFGGNGWHKDNADRNNAEAPDWASPYTQLRFGIYTQDHSNHSGGLNVRGGSHDICDLSTGPVRYLESEIGDLGVWSMRITHSANGVLLKEAPGRNRTPGPFVAKKIDPSEYMPLPDGKRVVLFSAIGAIDDHYERYVKYLKTRTYAADQWRASKYTDEHISAMEKVGVKVRDVGAELDGDPSVGINAAWKPIPF